MVPGSEIINNRVKVPSHFWTAYFCLDNNNKCQISSGFIGQNKTVKDLETELTKLYNVDSFELFDNSTKLPPKNKAIQKMKTSSFKIKRQWVIVWKRNFIKCFLCCYCYFWLNYYNCQLNHEENPAHALKRCTNMSVKILKNSSFPRIFLILRCLTVINNWNNYNMYKWTASYITLIWNKDCFCCCFVFVFIENNKKL